MKTDNKAIIAVNILKNILKELTIRAAQYNLSPDKIKALSKAYKTLDCYPHKTIDGYIDISANTHIDGGGLDYSSFTISSSGFEIYRGFVSYSDGECDNSSWEKIFASSDLDEPNKLNERLSLFTEAFLLHLELNPSRSLLIIDRSVLL